MVDVETPLPPVEIPWKLAATTQPLSRDEPAETALSLFFFEPDDATLTSLFPDDRLVFVKFTASIAPAAFPPELSRVAASFLGEGIPCMHLLLDLKVRNAAGDFGTIRPYFHAAAPLSRRWCRPEWSARTPTRARPTGSRSARAARRSTRRCAATRARRPRARRPG